MFYDYDDDYDYDYDDDDDEGLDASELSEYINGIFHGMLARVPPFHGGAEESSKDIGEYGEDLTASALARSGRFGSVFHNLYVPFYNGATTEVDVLFLTVKGIFVIESKNYSGAIIGRDTDKYWTQKLFGGEMHRFYNPILQNKTHINALKEYLNNPPVPLISWIVFSERCSLRYVHFRENDCVVLHRDQLKDELNDMWETLPDVLSYGQFIDIKAKLKSLQEARDVLRKRHYRSKGHSKTSKICPRCGASLILRTARKGTYAGKQFYGCSAFPKCRYIQNID